MATKASTTNAPAEGAAEGGEASRRPLRMHHLRPAPGAKTPRTRVGRGEGSKGKTAGRGTKGSKARGSIPVGLEGGALPLHMRLPKMRGFASRNRVEYQVVNLYALAELYPDGGEVTPADLAAKGAVRSGRPVKILGTGDATAAWQVSADAFSTSASEKITAAGGSVTKR
jgi:large subunit ribosomal protein L15